MRHYLTLDGAARDLSLARRGPSPLARHGVTEMVLIYYPTTGCDVHLKLNLYGEIRMVIDDREGLEENEEQGR